MATIRIGDLSVNTDLDRKAMQAISGGARLRAAAGTPRPGSIGQPDSQRIVDFRTGVAPGQRANDIKRKTI